MARLVLVEILVVRPPIFIRLVWLLGRAFCWSKVIFQTRFSLRVRLWFLWYQNDQPKTQIVISLLFYEVSKTSRPPESNTNGTGLVPVWIVQLRCERGSFDWWDPKRTISFEESHGKLTCPWRICLRKDALEPNRNELGGFYFRYSATCSATVEIGSHRVV